MAKAIINIKKEIEIERGMIFKKDENTYVLTSGNEEGDYILSNISTGRRFCEMCSLNEIAEKIEEFGMIYLGFGEEFELVKKEEK